MLALNQSRLLAKKLSEKAADPATFAAVAFETVLGRPPAKEERERCEKFLRDQAAGGRTVLLSSHLMGELAEIADDVVVIHQGRILAQGGLADVTGGHATLEDAFFALTATETGGPW